MWCIWEQRLSVDNWEQWVFWGEWSESNKRILDHWFCHSSISQCCGDCREAWKWLIWKVDHSLCDCGKEERNRFEFEVPTLMLTTSYTLVEDWNKQNCIRDFYFWMDWSELRQNARLNKVTKKGDVKVESRVYLQKRVRNKSDEQKEQFFHWQWGFRRRRRNLIFNLPGSRDVRNFCW